MGGIIFGALSGLGNGMLQEGRQLHDSAMQDQQQQHAVDLTKLSSDLSLQREQALDQFRTKLATDTASQQRTAMTDRIQGAQEGIIGKAIASKYASSDAAVSDADAGLTDAPLTDEQQAAIAQSKQIDHDKLMDSPDVYTKAAIQTGDIDPKTAATLTSKQDLQQMKYDSLFAMNQMKIDMLRDKALGDQSTRLLVGALRGENGHDKTPSNVQTAKWLVENGVAKDNSEAWDMVSSGKSKDPIELQVRTASMIMANGLGKFTPDQAWEQAGKLLDKASDAVTPPGKGSTVSNPVAPASRPPLSSFRK